MSDFKSSRKWLDACRQYLAVLKILAPSQMPVNARTVAQEPINYVLDGYNFGADVIDQRAALLQREDLKLWMVYGTDTRAHILHTWASGFDAKEGAKVVAAFNKAYYDTLSAEARKSGFKATYAQLHEGSPASAEVLSPKGVTSLSKALA